MDSDAYRPDPQIVVDGVSIDFRRKGAGRPLLFLAALEGWIRDEAYTDRLAEHFEVLLPQHPGFGHSELPHEFQNVGDLAHFYLTLMEAFEFRDVVLVGSSFGGWVAMEIAVRSTERLSHLVLVDSFGIKVGGRDDRDITDIYALSQAEVAQLFYCDPERNRRDVTQLDDHVLEAIARSRETMCLFGWQPYMHNPTLRRWLRRIRIPSLVVWGAEDGIVKPDYGRALAAELPDSRFQVIQNAGHYPHLERPETFVEAVVGFVAGADTLSQSA